MPTALIDFAAPDGGEPLRVAFGQPQQELVAQQVHEVRAVLDAAEAHARAGRWCVGFVRYEAAPAFDTALATHPADGPLAWFGVFDQPAPAPWPDLGALPLARADWPVAPGRAAFDADLQCIHAAIAAGELYQVNHTAMLQGQLRQGTPQALFAALRRAQPGGYAAFLDAGNEQVLSVSPELFFDWREDGHLLTRPMKGTAPRGASAADDAARAAALRASPKERAENVMVVDLLRNDVSRVAEQGSVAVPRLFHLQALPTVWQMTSDVVARTRAGTRLADVFAALFPCGSVTGAPKVQAMRRIRGLEAGPRGVYCGAVGVLRPGGHATFNVPIRTVTAHGDRLRCGIGSGITSDAQADGEWREWRHKRAFLHRASTPFELLETLALEGGACRHIDAHLARMAGAAAHFGFPWREAAVRAALAALAGAHPQGLWRARLLVDCAGQARAEAFVLPDTPVPVQLRLAPQPFEMADSEFTRFKTTHRAHYDLVAPASPDLFDTLLWNERGELTECTRGNIAIELDGRWLTPALACGLLPGIGRAVMLTEGRMVEGTVRVEDLPRATGLAFLNSLRGWLPARLAR